MDHISRLSQEAEKVNWKWVRLQILKVMGFFQQGCPTSPNTATQGQALKHWVLPWLIFYCDEEAP